MIKEDKEVLKELILSYSSKDFMKSLKEIVAEAADHLSDVGFKERAAELSVLAQSLEDITSGRPFLV